MPNWCTNSVTIKHDDPAVIAKISEAFNKGEFLQSVVPMPDKPEVPEGGVLDSMPDWYQWRVANWGTKWDIGEDGGLAEISPNEISLGFDSAWGPPTEAYNTMVENGFDIVAMYHEYGMCFYGTYENGVDTYGEYSKFDEIPVGITEEFGIDSSFFEDEDLTT